MREDAGLDVSLKTLSIAWSMMVVLSCTAAQLRQTRRPSRSILLTTGSCQTASCTRADRFRYGCSVLLKFPPQRRVRCPPGRRSADSSKRFGRGACTAHSANHILRRPAPNAITKRSARRTDFGENHASVSRRVGIRWLGGRVAASTLGCAICTATRCRSRRCGGSSGWCRSVTGSATSPRRGRSMMHATTSWPRRPSGARALSSGAA